MRESRLESYFRREVTQRGGWTIKLTGTKGIPDRLVMLPGGNVVFVELKTDKGRLSKIQKAVIAKLDGLGCSVEVLYGKDQVDEWLAAVS
jgi:hypothetical protein